MTESVQSELEKTKHSMTELNETHKKTIANYEERLSKLKSSIETTQNQQ